MDLRSLSTFVQIAEAGSFTRAAEQLGYSQPAISIQIKQLEKELGVQLFDRIGHTVRLTEEGRNALYYAQRICHMCQQLQQEQHQQPRGTIRLGMADSVCSAVVSRGFLRFRRLYPHISLNITARGTGELFSLLEHNEVDMVCTLDSHIFNTNYVIAAEEKVGVHFAVPADSPLARLGRLTVRDLPGQSLLLTEKGMSYRRLLEEMLSRQSIELQPALEIGSADLICQLVEQGAGISFLPDYVTEEAVRRGTVVRLEMEDFQPELWKQLIYHRDKWVSLPMQAVINDLSGMLLQRD